MVPVADVDSLQPAAQIESAQGFGQTMCFTKQEIFTMKSELVGIESCNLHRRTPYGMTNVSMTQFSIARHYGGCKFQGDSYTYIPTTDELIRDDVLKWKRKQKRVSLNKDFLK